MYFVTSSDANCLDEDLLVNLKIIPLD